MISKNKQKLIRSLTQKKNRDELNLFVAEGHKVVEELLPYFSCRFLRKFGTIKRILSVDFTLKTRYKDTSVSALLSLEDNV